jgi:hypothetical protein
MAYRGDVWGDQNTNQIGSLGSNCGIEDLTIVCKANELWCSLWV